MGPIVTEKDRRKKDNFKPNKRSNTFVRNSIAIYFKLAILKSFLLFQMQIVKFWF